MPGNIEILTPGLAAAGLFDETETCRTKVQYFVDDTEGEYWIW